MDVEQITRKVGGVYRQIPTPANDFDFGEHDPAHDVLPEADERIAQLSEDLRVILEWLVDGAQGGNERYVIFVARKLLAMVWVLRPELLGNLSLRALSRSKKFRTRAATFSRYAVEFSDLFGVRNPMQQTLTARVAMARSAKRRKPRNRAKTR